MKWTRGPVIGRGSSATVYLATTATGDRFAVKSCNLSTSISLQQEQHILSQLNSPYIISYKGYDITYNNNMPMYNLHMEYATRGTISDVIKKHGGSLDEDLIRCYTYQILLGLDYLHLNKLVHCDIKCGNILVCDDGVNVKIGDLGCAKLVDNNMVYASIGRMSSTGPTVNEVNHVSQSKLGENVCIFSGSSKVVAGPTTNVIEVNHVPMRKLTVGPTAREVNHVSQSKFSGTPVFMAPEVVRGEEQGFAADVWALGCVIIEMATGCNPWPDVNDPISGLYRIGYSDEVPKLPQWLSPECQDFLNVCLKRDAKERYSIKELLKHPFVVNLDMGFDKVEEFTKNSPTSVLNQDFWGCLEVAEISPETTRNVEFSGDLPAERIMQLVKGGSLCLPNWRDEEDWIIIRSE